MYLFHRVNQLIRWITDMAQAVMLAGKRCGSLRDIICCPRFLVIKDKDER